MHSHDTISVMVGPVRIGGGAPIAVQSMTNTRTADAKATANQVVELAQAGADLVRITVDTHEAATAVPEIASRIRDAGCPAPLIGDFHYNGHLLLRQHPDCAKWLDKYRINPGNVGAGNTKDERFATICNIAADNGKAIRIGVNIGSLDQELVEQKMSENLKNNLGKNIETILNECMILSVMQSTESALANGLTRDRIILSCKTSSPTTLVHLYRSLAQQTQQPLHLGLTEAGLGVKGIVWSIAPMGILLAQGIGDTIRVSLTPGPNDDRRDEVYAACELLQALGLRHFMPSVTACPGCGRTSGKTFQELAQRIQTYVRENATTWRNTYNGVENMTIAVMGCIVNGPGESKAANIGISLPGAGETPQCPVYMDGKKVATLNGDTDELVLAFQQRIDEYINAHYTMKTP